MRTNADIARACFQAYADGDRAALDAVLAADLHFTSPLDNGIDLNTYLEICWPTQAEIVGFRFVRVVEHGDTVLLTYEQTRSDGSVGRNTEVLTIRDGLIHAVEVYFGWPVPHPAAPGTHLAAE
ncbi:nuclear transport factor 2 family protein [Luteimonas terrae]|uniref:Ketosteroid isomerase-like protein n=1 Tax=Luteimonas terrae TaxID=1530191 RepID=A0ABU1XTG5_9GAMM|nr:nuclear transport factor 2 family protein [Luteimonas terrae]MDR7191525.1 ketosteroid isomerase-like protein [Luteimonas terrae]